jgi:hypothetical protein
MDKIFVVSLMIDGTEIKQTVGGFELEETVMTYAKSMVLDMINDDHELGKLKIEKVQ